MRKIALFFLLLVCAISPQPLCGQSTPAARPVIRYHFGDNPAWASPSLDDSSWPVAPNGLMPSRSSDADRLLWIRIRVPVPDNATPPLALDVRGLGVQPLSWQVFVNGRLLGHHGAFPPHADPVAPPVFSVINLPPALAPRGSAAVVALREWSVSTLGGVSEPSRPSAIIGEESLLQLTVRADKAEALIADGPVYAVDAVLSLAGVVLLFVWRLTRRRECLWAAILLLFPFLSATLNLGPITAHLSFRVQTLLLAATLATVNSAEFEFLWTLFRLRWRGFRILYYSSCTAMVLALIAETFFLEAPAIFRLCQSVVVAFFPLLDCFVFPVCAREIFRPNGNRAIAATFGFMEACVLFVNFSGYSVQRTLGPFHLNLIQLAIYAVELAIGAMLIQRAWIAWKERSALRAEFDAAREVQQQLVTAVLPPGDGLRIKAAYLPAQEVGGDFYQVFPQSGGSALIVVGDVSGKGLKAAMTGTLALGALRNMAHDALSPSQILTRLNLQLCASSDGGFITCVCARIAPDGTLTVANAGHLAPYRNGEEIPLDSSLPLGIAPDTAYSESTLHLAPNDQLTFLSDGVVEAQSATGELFGFDRTRAISTQSAEEIARAAQTHGQQDDITVLTITFVPAEVAHA